MPPVAIAELTLLAALWGGAFLFMRVGVAEFGPFALIELRVAVAALLLGAVLAWRGAPRHLAAAFGRTAWMGVINSAVPFTLIAWATLSMGAGMASILNATAPIFGAIVAWCWLGERFTFVRACGLALGVAGVGMLMHLHGASLEAGGPLPVAAVLGAALAYGIAACYARRRLRDVDPLAAATGSQIGATLALLPFALSFPPAAMPSLRAWAAVLALGVFSTALAYVLYFRLIATIGASGAITVTFLIPAFGVLWGAAFLGEEVTFGMLAGAGAIVGGTALASHTGARR